MILVPEIWNNTLVTETDKKLLVIIGPGNDNGGGSDDDRRTNEVKYSIIQLSEMEFSRKQGQGNQCRTPGVKF